MSEREPSQASGEGRGSRRSVESDDDLRKMASAATLEDLGSTEARSQQLIGWVSPRFKDSELEEAWTLHQYRLQTEYGKSRVQVTMALTFGIMLFADVQPGWMLDDMSFYFRAIGSIFILMAGGWCLLFYKRPALAGRWFNFVATSYILFGMLFAGATPDRMARTNDLSDWRPFYLMEANAATDFIGVASVGVFFYRLPPGSCLFFLHVGVICYLTNVAIQGSRTYDVVSDVYGEEMHYMGRHCILAFKIYVLGAIYYTARKDSDKEDRFVFVKIYKLHKATLLKNAQIRDAEEIERERRHYIKELEALYFEDGSKSTSTEELTLSTDSSHQTTEAPRPTRNSEVPTPSFAGEILELKTAYPNPLLVDAMRGRKADWKRIRRMATSCHKPEYTLRTFFDDCLSSFPELLLFFATESAGGKRTAKSGSSGRTALVEYQRTVGALFAVYWFLRLKGDGPQSFTFGVDDNWAPLISSEDEDELLSSVLFTQMSEKQKRHHFLRTMDWSEFQKLVETSGCTPGKPDSVDRIMAMLCLTSFHDIMKVRELLPTVHPDHGPYRGYKAGSVINDHDVALSYILEFYPELLPSFAGLPDAQRKSVIFTQSKLEFNHGWFVQSEAPPGAMLTTFKEALAAGADPADIGFYFFHWITDLSGAEATPLNGAEKFVLKFPHTVLASFLWSIPFLTHLAVKGEIDVMEEYLEGRWRSAFPDKPVPSDSYAIARMRLMVMAQGDLTIVDLFNALPPMESLFLAEELQRTAIKGQFYKCDASRGGPAILIYYGPALLQRNVKSRPDLAKALNILIRVLKAVRQLWQLRLELEGTYVTIQIGELKALDIDEVVGCPASDTRRVWVVQRLNDLEGVVSLKPASELNGLLLETGSCRVVDFEKDSPFDYANSNSATVLKV